MPLSTSCSSYSYMLLSLLAASTSADTIWIFLPTCAQSCAEQGANAASICDSTDYGCYCASAEFHKVTMCCVRASCDFYDDELVYTESQAFCGEYGVTVTSLAATACSTTYGAGPTSTALSAVDPSVTTGVDTGITALGTGSITGLAGSTIIESPAAIVTTTVSVSGGYITVTYTYPDAAAATDTSGSSSSSSPSSSGGSSVPGLTSSKNKKGRLSNGAKIGIGVGVGVGGLLLIVLVALGIYKCVTRRRVVSGEDTAIVAGKSENGNGSTNGGGGGMYNNKSEMDGSQQLQQQQQQHNQPAPSNDSSGTAMSLVSSSLTGPSELQTIQQGYYHHPNGDSQELATQYPYYEQQQQAQEHGWTAAQAEMPVSQEHPRHEVQ